MATMISHLTQIESTRAYYAILIATTATLLIRYIKVVLIQSEDKTLMKVLDMIIIMMDTLDMTQTIIVQVAKTNKLM